MKKKEYPNEGSPVDEFLNNLVHQVLDVGIDGENEVFSSTITMDNGQKIHGQIDPVQLMSCRFISVETGFTSCDANDGSVHPASMVLVDVNKISSISIKNKERVRNGIIGFD